MLVKGHRGEIDRDRCLAIKTKWVYCCYAVTLNHATPSNAEPQNVRQTLLSPSFMLAISYSPPPSLPLPLPVPRVSPTPSSARGFELLVPKLMGRSSRHWQAQTPREVMIVALMVCRAHQKRCEGIACVYKDVTIRWIRCTVRAKSRTSFERAISRRMKMALLHVSAVATSASVTSAAYLVRLLSIQTSPRVQPTVVSPRSVSQLKSRSRLMSFPATSAVKTMSTAAHA